MTTITDSSSTSTTVYRPPVAAIAVGSALVAVAGTAVGAHDWRELLVVMGIIAVVTALVFGLVVPRALRKESAGGTSLALSIPAVLLLLPAFWSGLPMVLGAAGLLVGNAGRRAERGAGLCIAGVVLGALAMIGYVAIYVSDASNGGLGFLFD